MTSTTAQKQRVEFTHGQLSPSGAAVVALVGAFGFFHLAQQGVHLVQRQFAVRPYRAVTGHSGQNLVLRALDNGAGVVQGELVEATGDDVQRVEPERVGRRLPRWWRRAQLTALSKMMSENETRIAEALATDLGRKPFEAWLADVASLVAEAEDAAKHVGKWTKRRYRLLERSQLPGRGWVEYEPYGTVLVIGAWNFPFALTLGPLVGVLAAGNAVVLKPSELDRKSVV